MDLPKDNKYIEDKGNGKFRIRFRVASGLNMNNSYVSKQISNSTIDEAILLRNKLLLEYYEKGKVDSTMKVSVCLDKYFSEVADNEQEGTTIDDKKSKLSNHFLPHLGNKRMIDVKRSDIQELITLLKNKDSKNINRNGEIKKLSPTTIKNIYNIIRAFFSWASHEDVGILSISPCRHINLPKVIKEDKTVFDNNEILDLIKLISSLDTQTKCLYLIPLFSGLRRGEVSALKWSNINFDLNTIYVEYSFSNTKSKGATLKGTKTNRNRTTIINDILKESLFKLKLEQETIINDMGIKYIDNDFIFTNEDGSNLTPNAIGNRWKRFKQKHKLKDVSYHGLRATFASFLSYSNIPIKEIADVLGHSETRTTTKYYTMSYDTVYDKISEVTNVFKNDK